MQSAQEFTEWLANTPVSQWIQNTLWVIPAVQTVHILAIAVVVAAVFLIDLRFIGVVMRAAPLSSLMSRFLPCVWYSLIVLLISGTLLIVAEPGRSLTNPAFIAKMSMLLTVIAITLLLARPLRQAPDFWEISAARRGGSRLIALVSLTLWMSIVFAGRWIAYIEA